MINWIKNYITSPTHKWWVEKVWTPSWTKFTTFIYGIPAAIVAMGQVGSNIIHDSTLTSYLSSLNIPSWTSYALAGLAVIHFIAHGRED